MISFYTGTPGSGKSYHLAQRIFYMLRYQKINVIANFDVNLDYVRLTRIGWYKHRLTQLLGIKFRKYNTRPLKGCFEYWTNPEITPEHLLEFAAAHHKSHREGQTLVILDEAGIIFNCRDFGSKDRQKWTDFFAKHRHYGFDFVLATQFDRQVDKQIRMCVEYETVHRKLKNYKLLGRILSMLAGGNIFIVKQYWYASRDKLSNDTDMLRYSSRIGALYDTFAEFARDGSGSAAAGGGRGPARGAAAAPMEDNVTQSDAAASLIRARLRKNLCDKEGREEDAESAASVAVDADGDHDAVAVTG